MLPRCALGSLGSQRRVGAGDLFLPGYVPRCRHGKFGTVFLLLVGEIIDVPFFRYPYQGTGRLGLGKCGKGPTRNPSLVQ